MSVLSHVGRRDAVQAVALGVASELSIARGEPVELAEVLGDPATADHPVVPA